MKNFIIKPDNLGKISRSSSGFTLIELLGALIISGIVIAVASAGLGAIHNASRKADVRNTRRTELSRAIAYINNDIKEGKTITSLPSTDANCSSISGSGDCLVITKPTQTIYYRFADISSLTSVSEFKPGILYRKEGTTTAQPLIDGLAIEDENGNALTLTCPTGFNTTVYGDKGFRFCLGTTIATNKLVQIYLYGYTGAGGGDTPIAMTVQSFARSN